MYAALLLLPNARGFRCCPDLFMQWMLAKACSNAPHILLKMSQGSTACLGFEFPQWPWQGPTCRRQPVKNVAASASKCRCTALDNTKSRFLFSFSDMLSGLSYKPQVWSSFSCNLHKYQTKLRGLEDKNNGGFCSLSFPEMSQRSLFLMDGVSACYHKAHLCKLRANLVMAQH